ncbi:MAG: chemotaxis protein CheD [Tepidiformaceae bacterium]
MTAAPSVQRRVSIGIAEIVVSREPAEILVAYGLGSCVGVTVFDAEGRLGGMAHVLLPASEGRTPGPAEPARFADCGIDALLQLFTDAGAIKRRLIVKIAGGGSVLGPANAQKFKIGERNAEAIKERLRHHGLSVVSSELGGVTGRTLELHVASGKTFVRTATSQAAEL